MAATFIPGKLYRVKTPHVVCVLSYYSYALPVEEKEQEDHIHRAKEIRALPEGDLVMCLGFTPSPDEGKVFEPTANILVLLWQERVVEVPFLKGFGALNRGQARDWFEEV